MRRTTLNTGGLDFVFGLPREANTTVISLTSSPASGFLDPESSYRIVATEDCYIDFIQVGGGPVTTAGVFIPGNVPEIFSTDNTYSGISAMRSSVDGTLFITKMSNRRE